MPQTTEDIRNTLWGDFELEDSRVAGYKQIVVPKEYAKLVNGPDILVSEEFLALRGTPKRLMVRIGPASLK